MYKSARVAELAYAYDSKSYFLYGIVGSTPTSGTRSIRYKLCFVRENLIHKSRRKNLKR